MIENEHETPDQDENSLPVDDLGVTPSADSAPHNPAAIITPDMVGLPPEPQPAADTAKEEAAPAQDKPPQVDDEEKIPEDDPSKYVGVRIPTEPNPNIGECKPVFFKPTSPADVDTPFHMSGIPYDVNTFNLMLTAFPSMNYDNGAQTRQWRDELLMARENYPNDATLSRAFGRPNSKWMQRVPDGNNTLGLTSPSTVPGGEGRRLEGDNAVIRAMSELGVGTMINVPLWNSGIWLSLKPPQLINVTELLSQIESEKIELGRASNGAVFSSQSVYRKNYIIDFVLAHVSSSTADVKEAQDLKDVILINDYPTMVWGILAAMFPSGYPYHQPCMNDPSKCKEITKEMINFHRIFFTDMTQLTPRQIRHMARRNHTFTMKELDDYRSDFSFIGSRGITIQGRNGKLGANLRIPTLTQYLSHGFSWVNSIVADVERAFSSNLQGQQREAFINDRATSSALSEYSHWLKEIIFSDGSVTDDEESIRSILTSVSGDPELSDSYYGQIKDYMVDSTITLLGVPRFDCPVCGAPTSIENHKHPYVNAIDVEQLFFTSAAQRTARALILSPIGS